MNVSCLVCKKSFDQEDADHYDDGTPVAQRWTCSRTCRKRIEHKAKKAAQFQHQVKELGLEDLAEESGMSEAAKARAALAEKENQPALLRPEEAPTLSEIASDDVDECLDVATTIGHLARRMRQPVDQYVMIGLSMAFTARAQELMEARYQFDEPDAPPEEEQH